ncbi:QRFP-like peptide receptor isoform X2 [Montipora foliosa]|uniref:QRFP-like peptide receptor isoform X2 n=1 Tax=Montipora foliosa TaxID=591990 RepID=UPI0035F1CB6D
MSRKNTNSYQRRSLHESVMSNFQIRNDSDLPNRTTNVESFSSSVCIGLLTTLGIEAVAIVTLNALAIMVFVKERRLRKRSMYLTISLAVADMLNAWTLIFWIFSLPVKITVASPVYFSALSTTNLTAISLERVHATFHPFKHRLVKKKVFGAAVAAVWFTAGLFTALTLLRPIQFDAFWNSAGAGAYVSFLLCCPFIILVSYTAIAIKFYGGTHPQHHGGISRERKLTKTLFIVTLVSLSLLLPGIIALFSGHVFSWKSSEPNSHQTRWLLLYSLMFLFCANSFINPLLYAFRMPEFKRALLLLLRCRFRSEPAQVFPLSDM